MTIILYDFETTGLDPLQHDPIQLAAVALHPRTLERVGEWSATMRPRRPENASQKALDVHGLTLEHLATQADPTECAREFAAWVMRHGGRPIPCGYNLPFDEGFMAEFCPSLGRLWNYRKLDVMQLAMAHLWLPGKVPDLKLVTVAQHLGIKDHQAHDAMGDVLATADVLRLLTGNALASSASFVATAQEVK